MHTRQRRVPRRAPVNSLSVFTALQTAEVSGALSGVQAAQIRANKEANGVEAFAYST